MMFSGWMVIFANFYHVIWLFKATLYVQMVVFISFKPAEQHDERFGPGFFHQHFLRFLLLFFLLCCVVFAFYGVVWPFSPRWNRQFCSGIITHTHCVRSNDAHFTPIFIVSSFSNIAISVITVHNTRTLGWG